MKLQENLLDYMNNKNTNPYASQLEFGESHPVLTFRVLWLLMRLVSGGPKSNILRQSIRHLAANEQSWQVEPNVKWRVEALGVNARHFIMMNVSVLIRNWPISFITTCKSANLTWSDLLRGTDEQDLPYRYRELLLQFFHSASHVRSPTFSAKYT